MTKEAKDIALILKWQRGDDLDPTFARCKRAARRDAARRRRRAACISFPRTPFLRSSFRLFSALSPSPTERSRPAYPHNTRPPRAPALLSIIFTISFIPILGSWAVPIHQNNRSRAHAQPLVRDESRLSDNLSPRENSFPFGNNLGVDWYDSFNFGATRIIYLR